jgi:hypothetical protein
MTPDFLHMQIGFEAELWRWLLVLGALVALLAVVFGVFLALLHRREREERIAMQAGLQRAWRDTEYGVAPTLRDRAWMDIFDAELAGRSRS